MAGARNRHVMAAFWRKTKVACGVSDQRVKMKRVDPGVALPNIASCHAIICFILSCFLPAHFIHFISHLCILTIKNGRRDGSSGLGSAIWGRPSRNCARIWCFCLYIVPSSEESISGQSSWKTYCVYEIWRRIFRETYSWLWIDESPTNLYQVSSTFSNRGFQKK